VAIGIADNSAQFSVQVLESLVTGGSLKALPKIIRSSVLRGLLCHKRSPSSGTQHPKNKELCPVNPGSQGR
jgi:hypothetical protein